MLGRIVAIVGLLCFQSISALGSEADALAISANIRAKHMPFGTILDPVYASSASNQVVGYTRCGDSALWTGAYLAAEAFRYKVKPTPDALANVEAALAGLKSLADVTGDNRLGRCIVPASSPFAAGIESEEAHNTVHQSGTNVWLDNTSRDEVVGAFFGLSIAYDMVDDATVKSGIADLTTRLIGFVSRHQWSPNDDLSNTFLLRPEELRMLLQVANHVNPANGTTSPLLLAGVSDAVAVDVLSITSYFKFNLDYMTFYNLIRLQNNSDNQAAYKTVRSYTASHQNAFFDMVDRSISGANTVRDAEMRSLLDQWLQRPQRDPYVDVSKQVKVCLIEACDPVPVPLRPPTDFLWQRDPFQLSGGGVGTIESAGIDYILPYWMARYYGVLSGTAVQSAAAPLNALAPDSLASIFGTNLGNAVTVTDAAGTQRTAELIFSSAQQINLVIPAGTATGEAQFQIGTDFVAANIQLVAPTLFTMSGTGSGVAAALATKNQLPVPVFQCGTSGCVVIPLDVSGAPVYLSLYGTGIRHRTALSDVTVSVNGTSVPVLYAGPAPGFDGLDQINVQLLPSLVGAGSVNVVVTDGPSSNAVTIAIQ